MSGIVGLVYRDGRPVDVSLLKALTGFMTFRGPDAQAIWTDGPVGLGHTLLATTEEHKREQQPGTLDGQVWITADARIDGRAELKRLLEGKGRDGLEEATDVELILHAYHAWGDACLDYLIGDFAFAIWDGRRRHLFCARDHFGVKPFFYAELEDGLLFGNTLNCLRAHPAVSAELNDLAIADFLLFGFNQETDTTSFAEIQRLPPACSLAWNADSTITVHRYWTLILPATARYNKPSDYTERFYELLSQAIADRLRTTPIGVVMSGGLDSTTITAIARKLLSQREDSSGLHGYTTVTDMVPEEEGKYALQLARSLDIPLHIDSSDDGVPFHGWRVPELWPPEPTSALFATQANKQARAIASHSRLVLTGLGGDPVLFPAHSGPISYWWRHGLKNTVRDYRWFVAAQGRLPRLYLRSSLRGRAAQYSSRSSFPPWLQGGFVRRFHLESRWQDRLDRALNQPQARQPTRAGALWLLVQPLWPFTFDSHDPSATYLPAESRHPYFDRRLVSFLLSLPPVPWCVDKEIVRQAMAGILPESIRQRAKTPMPGSLSALMIERHFDAEWLSVAAETKELANYVDLNQFLRLAGSRERLQAGELHLLTRPLGLAFWLQRLSDRQPRLPRMRSRAIDERRKVLRPD